MTTTDPTLTVPAPGIAGPSDQLWRWSGTEMAHAVATGLVSSREIVQSCLGRIEEVNPGLHS